MELYVIFKKPITLYPLSANKNVCQGIVRDFATSEDNSCTIFQVFVYTA